MIDGDAREPRVSLDASGGSTERDGSIPAGKDTPMADQPTVPDTPAGRADRIEEIVEFVAPVVTDVLRRLEGDEFSTVEFIEVMRSDPDAGAAYDEALRRWGEGERRAKMVVHGQVIPAALRMSGLVEWLGFAHGEDDPYAVPARWRLATRDATPGP